MVRSSPQNTISYDSWKTFNQQSFYSNPSSVIYRIPSAAIFKTIQLHIQRYSQYVKSTVQVLFKGFGAELRYSSPYAGNIFTFPR